MNHIHRHYRIPEPRPATLALAAGALATATGWATTTRHLRQRTRELHHVRRECLDTRRALDDAQHDHVTGLLNRRTWEHTAHTIRRYTSTPWVVGLVDMDDFKTINDQYGHHAGDEVLRTTANRLRYELGTRATIGRYGGDELVFLTTHHTDLDTERLRANLARPVHLSGIGAISVRAAIGTVSPSPGEPLAVALAAADAAMYAQKHDHRSYHESAPSAVVNSRSSNDLERAKVRSR
ncbi:GGDEF domain-containing protein [Saccharopolyspora endophytica]|uniref:GGDEF domain-containing protein n=1 Tax=Saccharopolyspora endophytica TaxID=543886 RepID=A0ABS5DRA0_9PSEU|nr:GGDEF domain-containing protein [Saccharopolyspora endophytica]MBQ0928824.1 GGDEF domain-containing protein [Saccharopolyspora endophytica]